MSKHALRPVPSAFALAPLDVFLPPAYICPCSLALLQGYSCSSMCQDALCPAPFPLALIPVDTSLPPLRTFLDRLELELDCSCSSVSKDAFGLATPAERLRRFLPFPLLLRTVPMLRNICPIGT